FHVRLRVLIECNGDLLEGRYSFGAGCGALKKRRYQEKFLQEMERVLHAFLRNARNLLTESIARLWHELTFVLARRFNGVGGSGRIAGRRRLGSAKLNQLRPNEV